MHRAGDAALLPLVALADIHEHRRVVGGKQLLGALCIYLFDRLAGGSQKFSVARHAFNCIAGTWGSREDDGYRRRMSPRGRVFFFVTLAAVVASGVVVLGVVATRDHVAAAAKPRAGHPPLALDLGVRTDPEARALGQAQQLYKNKQAARAGRSSAAIARSRPASARRSRRGPTAVSRPSGRWRPSSRVAHWWRFTSGSRSTGLTATGRR